jgi:cytoskeletal protein RodZ
MHNDPSDETIKEILKEDQEGIVKDTKKKSCLVRGLIFIILLAILFFGFIFIQQYLLDLEAEAIVQTAKTATAMVKDPLEKDFSAEEEFQPSSDSPTDMPTPTETSTPDPVIERTATIAAQLTSVAEFQLTVTDEP